MKVQLLVSKWCQTCPQAETIWKEAAEKQPMDLKILDVADKAGWEVINRLRIKTVPAVVIDGTLKTVGVQPLTQILQLLDS